MRRFASGAAGKRRKRKFQPVSPWLLEESCSSGGASDSCQKGSRSSYRSGHCTRRRSDTECLVPAFQGKNALLAALAEEGLRELCEDRKSTRLNSSHL